MYTDEQLERSCFRYPPDAQPFGPSKQAFCPQNGVPHPVFSKWISERRRQAARFPRNARIRRPESHHRFLDAAAHRPKPATRRPATPPPVHGRTARRNAGRNRAPPPADSHREAAAEGSEALAAARGVIPQYVYFTRTCIGLVSSDAFLID